jgi:hypothetical protein
MQESLELPIVKNAVNLNQKILGQTRANGDGFRHFDGFKNVIRHHLPYATLADLNIFTKY